MIKHAVIWVDHDEAKVFHVGPERFDAAKVEPHRHFTRHSRMTVEREHPTDALHFFQAVEKALADATEILVAGPGSAKVELLEHLQKHDHALVPRIVGIKTIDHPTDRQIVAFARRYFHGADRLRGTVP